MSKYKVGGEIRDDFISEADGDLRFSVRAVL